MLQTLLHTVSMPIIHLYGRRLKLNVARHTPQMAGPKIIIANHPTTSDPFLVAYLTKERARMLIIGHAFKIPVFGTYLRKSGHIPVIAGEGRRAFETAESHVREGGTLIIFPEGDLSPSEGGFKKPHSGAARLALLTGAPVIPMGISLSPHAVWHMTGSIDNAPVSIRWAKGGPYGVTIGRPLRFEGDVADRDYVKHVAANMMRHIMELAHESRERLQAQRSPVPYLWPAILEPVPAG